MSNKNRNDAEKLAAVAMWRVRKESRRLPPLIIPDSVRKEAERRGWKFRS